MSKQGRPQAACRQQAVFDLATECIHGLYRSCPQRLELIQGCKLRVAETLLLGLGLVIWGQAFRALCVHLMVCGMPDTIKSTHHAPEA